MTIKPPNYWAKFHVRSFLLLITMHMWIIYSSNVLWSPLRSWSNSRSSLVIMETRKENSKYLYYNVVACHTMCMYNLKSSASRILTITFYVWRIICNITLGSVIVLAFVDMMKNVDDNFSTRAVYIMNCGKNVLHEI